MAKVAKPATRKDAVKHIQDLRAIAEIPAIVKSKGGNVQARDYSVEKELNKKDLSVLTTLMATGGNKALTARIENIDRPKLYRLLTSTRVKALTETAKLRLESLAELAILVIEHRLAEDMDAHLAVQILKGLGVMKSLQQTRDPDNLPGKGKSAKFEEYLDEDGNTHRKQTLEEVQ